MIGLWRSAQCRLLITYGRLLTRTVRVTFRDASRDWSGAVWICWHEYGLVVLLASVVGGVDPLPRLIGRRDVRGDVIRRAYEWFGGSGFQIAYPPSRASGAATSREIIDFIRGGGTCVVTADGPGGPYRIAKPGAARLAARANARSIRLSFNVRYKLRLPRWDAFVVPLPWAKIAVEVSECGGSCGWD